MNAANKAKLEMIAKINEAIMATEDRDERMALRNMLFSPELDLEPEPEMSRYINYKNLGQRHDAEDRGTRRDERLITMLGGL